jgi:NADH-quinone oxidoreductase subunit G
MAKITVDGTELEVPDNSMLLPVLLDRGMQVPHYCYHPKLSIDGSCRMCLVKVEGLPKLTISCNTPPRRHGRRRKDRKSRKPAKACSSSCS